MNCWAWRRWPTSRWVARDRAAGVLRAVFDGGHPGSQDIERLAGEAARFVEPLDAVIVDEFFDVGQSRSLPWERRDEANRALQALKDPDRGWDGLVVGEATRCWYSNQFSLTWPKFDRYGVSLWIPGLGGRFDPENTAHDMAMMITDGLSKSERQCVQRRVRAAMTAQVLIDGRLSAAYGYLEHVGQLRDRVAAADVGTDGCEGRWTWDTS